MLNKCFSELACEYSDNIYDEFLIRIYGINSCPKRDCPDSRDDLMLQLELAKAGYKNAYELEKYNISLDMLEGINGVGNLYNIINNTYITNNYSEVTSAGYVHNQAVASTVWTISNPLGYYPNITIVDNNGLVINAQIEYDASDFISIILTFSEPVAGRAFLS